MADGGILTDQVYYKKTFEIVEILNGVSIAQAEAVLKDAGTMLKQSIWISSADVDEVKRQCVLPFEKED